MDYSNRNHEGHFEVVQRVLLGQAQREDEHSKMLFLILNRNRGADLEIARSHFVIRYGWDPSRHRYFLDVAPGVISTLMEWCGLERVDGPCAARMPGRSAKQAGRFPVVCAPHDVWFFPGPELLVMVRAASESPELPSSVSPPPPIRYAHRSITVAAGHACPHCTAESNTFRVIQEALLCPACQRSFEAVPPTDDLD